MVDEMKIEDVKGAANSNIELEMLIEDISIFRRENCPNMNLLDVLLEYSFKKDIELEQLGYMLAENEQFKELLEIELIKGKYMKIKENLPIINESEF